MSSGVKIHFSDKSILELHEKDFLIPIVFHQPSENFSKSFASMDVSVQLEEHINNGLIPSLMNVLCKSDFFYVNDNIEIVYGTHSIVRIEQN